MAEADLATLLKTLEVKRHDGLWCFATIPVEDSSWAELMTLASIRHIAMVFTEDEGLSVIHRADSDASPETCWVWLELSVYSDLNAVGFLSRIAAALTEAGVPCNAVAAYHHDHIFVPEAKAGAALNALQKLRQG